MPTQAPTGSTSESREATAILERLPGSLAQPSTWTMPSEISGTSDSNRDTKKLRVGPGQDDLGPPGLALDVQDVGPDALALVVHLPGHLLRRGQQRLGAAQVDDDALRVHALHDAVDDLAFAVLEVLKHQVPLRVLHALHDDLLGRLGGDAPEGGGVHLDPQAVPHFAFRVQSPGLRPG